MESAAVSHFEAERYIEELKPCAVENIGSAWWSKQRERLERLNVQAHANAQAHQEEFVKELLVSRGKIDALVEELLAAEAWRERVLPKMKREVAGSDMGHTQAYLAAHSETSVANLLEVTLYHQDACESASDDALLELADWCQRKAAYLLSPEAETDRMEGTEDAKKLLERSREEELDGKVRSTRFAAAMCSLAILRYLTDFLHKLPLGVMARLLDSHDAPLLVAALIEGQPWLRERDAAKGGGKGVITEVFEAGNWVELPKKERLRVTNPQAQCWLALCNLVLDSRCRGRYVWDEQRQTRLQRVKRNFNEVLFDQLPVLKELQRAIDEIALAQGPQASEVKQGRLVMEQVPEIRQRIAERSDSEWQRIAHHQASNFFADTPEARQAASERMRSLTELFDMMADLQGEPQPTPSSSQGQQAQEHIKERASSKAGKSANGSGDHVEEAGAEDPSPGIVSLATWWREHGKFKEGPELALEVLDDRDPEPVKIEEGEKSAQGARYKCRLPEGSHGAPLPGQGQAEVRVSGGKASAKLDLPVVKSAKEDGSLLDADERELPKACWITIGLLPRDGIALQVKVRRLGRVSQEHMDAATGEYFLYRPSVAYVTLSPKLESSLPGNALVP